MNLQQSVLEHAKSALVKDFHPDQARDDSGKWTSGGGSGGGKHSHERSRGGLTGVHAEVRDALQEESGGSSALDMLKEAAINVGVMTLSSAVTFAIGLGATYVLGHALQHAGHGIQTLAVRLGGKPSQSWQATERARQIASALKQQAKQQSAAAKTKLRNIEAQRRRSQFTVVKKAAALTEAEAKRVLLLLPHLMSEQEAKAVLNQLKSKTEKRAPDLSDKIAHLRKQIAACRLEKVGDLPGHEFHGNQYVHAGESGHRGGGSSSGYRGRVEDRGNYAYGTIPADKHWHHLAPHEKEERTQEIMDVLLSGAKDPNRTQAARDWSSGAAKSISAALANPDKVQGKSLAYQVVAQVHEHYRRLREQERNAATPKPESVPGRGAGDKLTAEQIAQQARDFVAQRKADNERRAREAQTIQQTHQNRTTLGRHGFGDLSHEELLNLEQEKERFRRQQEAEQFRSDLEEITAGPKLRPLAAGQRAGAKRITTRVRNIAGSVLRSAHNTFGVAHAMSGAVQAHQKGDYVTIARHMTAMREHLKTLRGEMGNLGGESAGLVRDVLPHVKRAIHAAKRVYANYQSSTQE